MCGLAGFFTGCSAEAFCAAAQLAGCAHAPHARAGGDIFANWYDRASVRRAPQRRISPEDVSLDMFPRDLVPVVAHPIIARRYPEAIPDLLILALYRYLDFTTNLEMFVVNETTRLLIAGQGPVTLSADERIDAHRLACDESYHALFCSDLTQQVIAASGRTPAPAQAPRFLQRLRERMAGDVGMIERFLFTAVSEMLITGNLSDARRHDTTPAAVRGVLGDHASDEVRHRFFYGDLMARLFHQAGDDAVKLAALIPDLLLDFLTPDLGNIMIDLASAGIARADAEEICDDIYAPARTAPYARSSSLVVLSLLTETGLVAYPQVADRLEATGLIEA